MQADIRYRMSPSTVGSHWQRKGYHGDRVFTSTSPQLWHREPVSMETAMIPPPKPTGKEAVEPAFCVCVCVCVCVCEIHWDDSSYLCEKQSRLSASALASRHEAVMLAASNGSYKKTHAPAACLAYTNHTSAWHAHAFHRQKYTHVTWGFAYRHRHQSVSRSTLAWPGELVCVCVCVCACAPCSLASKYSQWHQTSTFRCFITLAASLS